MRCEMNYDVVGFDARAIEWVQHVKLNATRKIIGVEEGADVSAEITAAACN
jgi:hypothetical protein